MTKLNFYIAALLALSLFSHGCTGVRNSYESLLDKDADKPLIVLEAGERREVLAVGNGFPGWWGYYPTIVSLVPAVASVACERGRSFIPFREPGIVFGGERCYIQTHKTGIAWLLPGNRFVVGQIPKEIDFTKVSGWPDSPPWKDEEWIKVKVVAASDR